MTTYTLRFAINGSETDEDVEEDSAAWTSKLSNLKITGGGGGPVKTASNWVCSFELVVPIDVAAKVRTVTVAVEGPWTDTLKAWMTSDTTDRAYRVVFHGDVTGVRVGLLEGRVEMDATDEMYGLMQRRARLAAATGSDIKTLLQDIETAHGLTMTGAAQFPDSTTQFEDASTLMTIYRPAQKRVRNGEFIAQALAGTCINCSAEWDGPITAPAMAWRPDFYWHHSSISTTRRMQIPMPRPQAFGFSDFGYAYDDHYARITVNGANSSTDYYGWARLDDAADRNALSNREASLTSMFNSLLRLIASALTVLGQTGYPSYLRPYQIDVSADHHYTALSGWTGATGETQETLGYWLATAMLGDQLYWLDTGDPGYESVTTALGAQKAADLQSAFFPAVDTSGPGGAFDSSTRYHAIRQITRTWTPTGGWMLELATYPHFVVGIGTDPTGDTGSGTD
jgi:hypothetical protein